MGVLKDFAAIPQRAIADRRLRERELRALMAICRAVDGRTGLAVISQGRVGAWIGCSRQKANAAISQLVQCGYLDKVEKRYSRSGGGGYLVYRVRYDEAEKRVGVTGIGDPAHVTDVDDSPVVTPNDDAPVSRTEVTHFKAEKTNSEVDTGQSARHRSSGNVRDDTVADGTRAWRDHRDSTQERFRTLFPGMAPRRKS